MAKKEDIEFAREYLKAVRYGVAWEGDPKRPTHKEMPDGYWVPWHVADLLLAGLKDDNNVPNAELTSPPCAELKRSEEFCRLSAVLAWVA